MKPDTSPDAPPEALFSLTDITDSQQFCFEVTRKSARNFYYGMKLTPEPKRSAMYTVYAFMRACDDLADEAAPNDPAAAERIEIFRAQMQEVCNGCAPGQDLPEYRQLWPAFAKVVRDYNIDPAQLNDMLDGQMSDVAGAVYHTFDDLYQYCYRVASVVGLVCISVWGHDGHPDIPKLAEQRGIALQLTNILRDVVEDGQLGRVYLPHEDFEHFGYDPADLLTGKADSAFDNLMRRQIDRAKKYYQLSASLEQHIDPTCRAACRVITQIYADLLTRIEQRPAAVLEGRVRLSTPHKLTIVARASIAHLFES
jgi:phytoene synthase